MNTSILVRFSLIICLSFTLLIACKSDGPEVVGPMTTAEKLKEQARNSSTKSAQYRQDSLDIAAKLRSTGKKPTDASIKELLSSSNDKKANNSKIPIPCDMLTELEVSKAFDVSEVDVVETDGKRRSQGNENSKSCFWRWTGGGVLVQISQNPLPDEVNDWCTRYINTKKSSGEHNMNGSKSEKFLYKDFNGPGKHNVYNEQLGRYYSTLGEDFIVTMIFNGDYSKKKELGLAKELMSSVFGKF